MLQNSKLYENNTLEIKSLWPCPRGWFQMLVWTDCAHRAQNMKYSDFQIIFLALHTCKICQLMMD